MSNNNNFITLSVDLDNTPQGDEAYVVSYFSPIERKIRKIVYYLPEEKEHLESTLNILTNNENYTNNSTIKLYKAIVTIKQIPLDSNGNWKET